MKSVISDFCKNKENVFFLLDMPSGFGMTYNFLECVFENYNKKEYKANAYDSITLYTTGIDKKKFITEYGYDKGFRVSAIKEPDEHSVKYEYNRLGQLTEIQTAEGEKYATQGTYDLLGRLISSTAGNGKETSRIYDSEKGVLSRDNK